MIAIDGECSQSKDSFVNSVRGHIFFNASYVILLPWIYTESRHIKDIWCLALTNSADRAGHLTSCVTVSSKLTVQQCSETSLFQWHRVETGYELTESIWITKMIWRNELIVSVLQFPSFILHSLGTHKWPCEEPKLVVSFLYSPSVSAIFTFVFGVCYWDWTQGGVVL
jgi:hypothetical protein